MPVPSFSLPALSRRLCLAAPLTLLAPAQQAQAAAYQRVMVRNAQLRLTRELRTTAEVAEFMQFWNAKKPVKKRPEQETDWIMSLDLIGRSQGERWLYEPSGLAVKIASGNPSVYQLPRPLEFNRLVGAPMR